MDFLHDTLKCSGRKQLGLNYQLLLGQRNSYMYEDSYVSLSRGFIKGGAPDKFTGC